MGGWLARSLGLPDLAPSVRCGLEGAILSLLAAAKGGTLMELLSPGVGTAAAAHDDGCGVSFSEVAEAGLFDQSNGLVIERSLHWFKLWLALSLMIVIEQHLQ